MGTREKRQEATFVNWLNAQFARANKLTPETKTTNLAEDLKSGVRLIKLMAILCPSVPVPKYNQDPKMRFAQTENLNRALTMVAAGGIKTVGIGADNIADSNLMLILGLIWSIIYHVRIGTIHLEEGQQRRSGKEGLLYWCQKQTASYAPQGVHVTNFTSSWRDGLALSAIIHHNRPEVLDFDKMKALGDRQAVITECVRVAEEQLGIPHLLEVDDMLIADDEKVIMAFVSEFFDLFSKQVQAHDAVRRTRTFLEREKALLDLADQYQGEAKAFKSRVEDLLAQAKLDAKESSLEAAWKELQAADQLRARVSKEEQVQCQRLVARYDNIQLTRRTHGRKPYEPPAGVLAGPGLKDLTNSLSERTMEYVREARAYYAEEKAKAEQNYVTLIEDLDTFLKTKEQEASDASGGDVEGASKQLAKVYEELAQCDLFNRTQEAVDHLERNGIPHYAITATHRRWDEVCWKLTQLKDFVDQKKSFVDGEKAKAKADDVPQAKLDEYLEIFKLFDKERTGVLGLPQFTNCLKGLGMPVPDEKVEELFETYSEEGGMSFERFISFMREVTGDTLSKDQVLTSFRTVAQNKDCLNSEVLKLIGDDLSAFCETHFPKGPDGYDYAKYLEDVFEP